MEELMQHNQLAHCDKNGYECKDCKKFFEGMEQMRRHIKQAHSYQGNKSNQSY
jgi:uncharacterized C2H2 Zn-finger protein